MKKNKNLFAQALTSGLLAGYGGKSKFDVVNRAGFVLKSSHYQTGQINYHDEWSNGGGQELVKVNGSLFTRVYAGGVVDEDSLKSLNITVPQIIYALKHFITTLTSNTRLFTDCPSQINGDWSYQYSIIDKSENPQVTIGKETVSFHNQIVFTHAFVLSPA